MCIRDSLKPGEQFDTPETVLVYSTEGLGGMSAIFHRLYRKRVCRGKFREKEMCIRDRLYDMVQTLKEYSMQLREMHQTQIDIRQNEIMKVLTIVTTLFMPLTLIAGCLLYTSESDPL